MSTKKSGVLTTWREYVKHLRPWAKRQFWKGERRAGQMAGKRDAGRE